MGIYLALLRRSLVLGLLRCNHLYFIYLLFPGDSFRYAWNFCEDIPVDFSPVQCTGLGKRGVVLQYAQVYYFHLIFKTAKTNLLSVSMVRTVYIAISWATLSEAVYRTH